VMCTLGHSKSKFFSRFNPLIPKIAKLSACGDNET
jgi:hypothetical protein